LNPDWIVESGIQLIYQKAIGNGGNEDQTKTYVSKNHESLTLAEQLVFRQKK